MRGECLCQLALRSAWTVVVDDLVVVVIVDDGLLGPSRDRARILPCVAFKALGPPRSRTLGFPFWFGNCNFNK